ncbi:hypothetical protein HPP92_005585 [Vanilla planifolia]|uniref:Cysteine-rich transmembrane domain-containing protein n=1 Tax=Vanilla planifolia TaxID=51239 RepID=A0A835VFJ2_VANPL|nr:hypothetical protein HPP92_005585 [Vanilla planifolia]
MKATVVMGGEGIIRILADSCVILCTLAELVSLVPLVCNLRSNSTPTSYPPPAVGHTWPYVAPPPVGYPTGQDVSYSQQTPAKTVARGDGFWKGCCAALCCCCVLDACF